MIATKTKPAGIDILIQALQSFLYVNLQKDWNMLPADYNSYGRVYRNQTDDSGYSPEVYTTNGEYLDSFFDDTVKVVSFFNIGETQIYKGGLSTEVALIFCVTDIGKIKPGVVWRADEEIRRDVQIHCHKNRFGFTMLSVDMGVDKVFREYSGWKKKSGIEFMDMHPYHCFRINFISTPYSISIC